MSDGVLCVVICLKQGADSLHMVQLTPHHRKTPSSLASFKSRMDLPFWYRLTQVVLENWPLDGRSSYYYQSHATTGVRLWQLES